MMRFSWLLIIGFAALSLPEHSQGQDHEEVARGARLWSMTCNRCHNMRSPIERTDDEWKVIVSHMRTRANLTKSEARAITAFLKASNEQQEQEGKGTRGAAKRDSTARATGKRGEDEQ